MALSTPNRGYALVATALAGTAVSSYLLTTHLAVRREGGLGAGLCNLSENVNCAAAALSDYSTVAGVPIALIGIAFYLAVGVAAGLALWASRRADAADTDASRPIAAQGVRLVFVGFALACVYSVLLASVSTFKLKVLCPGCALLYLTSFAGLGLSWWWLSESPLAIAKRLVDDIGATAKHTGVQSFLAVFALVVAAGAMTLRSTGADAEMSIPAAPLVSSATLRADWAPSLGPKDARVVLVAFSDFECPYCGRFAKTLHLAHERFPNELRIEFRHNPLPFHDDAPKLAKLAICAHRDGKFWEMHDALFDNQERVHHGELEAVLRQAGFDAAAMDRCTSETEIQSLLDQDRATGVDVGVKGTPSFVLNGRFYSGAYPITSLERMIRDAMGGAPTAAHP